MRIPWEGQEFPVTCTIRVYLKLSKGSLEMGYGFIHVGRFYYRVPISTGLLSDRGVVLFSACIFLVCVLFKFSWSVSHSKAGRPL
jgi:hypothetical protein